jgi:molecular chaperone GrpE
VTQGPEFEGEPIIRDKRRLDPETGELREASSAVGGSPDGGASAESPVPVEPADSAVEGEGNPLAAAKAEAADLADQLARIKADNYNLDQRFNAYVRRSRSEVAEARGKGRQDVVEALIGVLDDVDLARQHGELTGPFASIAEKLEGVLQGTFGMERFGAAGEEFDPAVHEALMHSTSEDATGETVQQVLQPGYKVGDVVIRPARVAVVGPQ